MSKGTIKIFIDDAEGNPEIMVEGVAGKGCVAMTKKIEDLFGANEGERTLTAEYEKRPRVANSQHIRHGQRG